MKYRILATALAVGVFTFGWFDLRSVFAQTVNTSVEQISLSASLFGSDNRIISNGTYEVRFGIYTANRAVADPYPSNADIGSRSDGDGEEWHFPSVLGIGGSAS